MRNISVPARFARRFPDPIIPAAERHVLFCAVTDIPIDIPRDPNPREQKINRGIWKEIRQHLLNQEGMQNSFHLKNKGITIIADRIEKSDDQIYHIYLDENQGIVDGGHTYQLILESLDEINRHNSEETNPINQYVKLEILTGLEPNLVVEVAGGLNTAVQVQKMSLHNLDEGFDWIKDELNDTPYIDYIAFRENEDKPFDARDIIAILDLFNFHAFPDGEINHPTRAYMAKGSVLENYIQNPEQYESLRPILKDVLKLHDLIRSTAMRLYNNLGGKKAGSLIFVEQRKKGKYQFFFLADNNGNIPENDQRLSVAVLYPMVAAFRALVKLDDSDHVNWATPNGYSDIEELWKKVGGQLMQATQDTNEEVGRKANAIGRSKNHWRTLYGMVQSTYLKNMHQ